MDGVKLSSYEQIVGPQTIEELQILAGKIGARAVQHINSTAVGGGVAEILQRMVPLLNELGVRTKWDVIKGGEDFFMVTKAFHNALQGRKEEITSEMYNCYLEYNRKNARELSLDGDIIFIHDPQPTALIEEKGRLDGRKRWVWRCHIDISHPNPKVWRFLSRYIQAYDATIFSMPSFAQQLAIRQFLIAPSIDPLSKKNEDLPREVINRTLDKYGIDSSRPIITQVSRFDWLKDPLGVIQAYRMVKRHIDCQLVLAGGEASDDPESAEVLAAVQEEANNDPDIHILELPPFSDTEINALQRGSTIVLQKSLREGFGLTVTEAMWKGKPVVGTAVGGIPAQIKNNITGVLVHSVEGCAYKIRYLLYNPEFAAWLGRNAREQVKNNFLLTRHLKDYLVLIISLDHPGQYIIHL